MVSISLVSSSYWEARSITKSQLLLIITVSRDFKRSSINELSILKFAIKQSLDSEEGNLQVLNNFSFIGVSGFDVENVKLKF